MTPLQRVSWLLLNVPSDRRGPVLKSLEACAAPHWDPYTNEIADLCHRAFLQCPSDLKRQCIVHGAEEFTDLLERQRRAHLAELAKARLQIQLVATIPQFVILAKNHAAPPVRSDSLEVGMRQVVHCAHRRLDISMPYISTAGVGILMKHLRPGSRRRLGVRLLTQLDSEHVGQNYPGVSLFDTEFRKTRATMEIRSPTDDEVEISETNAVLHAKIAVADGQFAYLGTGNVSKTALQLGFEVGVLVRGVLAEELQSLFDWAYTGHQVWQPPPAEAPQYA